MTISPLYIDGLRGRIAHFDGPHRDAPELLFIYGHHSSLERWWGIMELLSTRRSVTMPDLPGFGGMDSLYKIGKQATIDNLADYLASFIRQRYSSKQCLTIIGMSLGFVIVTRMLQRHPDLTANVTKLISLFGFAHKDDFILSAKRQLFLRRGSKIFSLPGTSSLYRWAVLNRFVLSHSYHRTSNAKEKFKDATREQRKAIMNFEIKLWQDDDLRTYMKTGNEFLTLDNTTRPVNLPIYHIAVANDRYFSGASVEKHFKQIFTAYYLLAELKNGSHAPTRIATANEAREIIPPELLDALSAE